MMEFLPGDLVRVYPRALGRSSQFYFSSVTVKRLHDLGPGRVGMLIAVNPDDGRMTVMATPRQQRRPRTALYIMLLGRSHQMAWFSTDFIALETRGM